MGKMHTKETQEDPQERADPKQFLQWHTAFCVGMQIELEAENVRSGS